MPKPVDKGTTYVPGLDGLRTLAVAVVILYHLDVSGVPGGLLGVGVFFTLSGYLITANLMRSWSRRGNLGLKTFWLRRFRRLAPAMIATVLAVLILTAALARGSLTDRAWEALSTFFYVNNWHTIFTDVSYFDKFAGPGPLDHMWSLSVEEQFYLVWPLVLLALLLGLRKRHNLVAAATVVLAVASFVLMAVLADSGADNTRAYEGTDTRAGGLLLGAALAVWLAGRREAKKSTVPSGPAAAVLGLVGVAGILAMVVLVGQEDMFLYRGGIALLTVAAVFAIVAVLRPAGLWSRVFGCLPMRWTGERSYGIYLWHMPVIAFLPDGWVSDRKLLSLVTVVVISVLLSALSWKFFEDPIRRHGVIGPVKDWWAGRRAARAEVAGAAEAAEAASTTPVTASAEAGKTADAGETAVPAVVASTTPAAAAAAAAAAPAAPVAVPARSTGRVQGYVGAGAAVILTAVVAIGAPSVLADPNGAATGAAPGAGQSMEVEDDGPVTAAPGTVVDGVTQMACTKVIHVGDSTSLGIFNPDMLPDPSDIGTNQYLAHGAPEVETSVFGGRNTTEGFEDYPSAVDSVAELLAQGQPEGTCWVIGTGVNDAANIAAGATYNEEDRIRMMLDQLKGQRVMWSTAWIRNDSGYYTNANNTKFNETLERVTKEYPNAVVWDWASEVQNHMDWFMEGEDNVHYGAEGNAARGRLFAEALTNAFPVGGPDPVPGGTIVHSDEADPDRDQSQDAAPDAAPDAGQDVG